MPEALSLELWRSFPSTSTRLRPCGTRAAEQFRPWSKPSGYALIRAVRDLTAAKGGRLPAIAVTAYASLRDREQALAAGFDAHLAKPVDPQELVTSVVKFISRQTARSALT